MAGSLAGLLTGLCPLALALALLNAGEGGPKAYLGIVARILLGVSSALVANWLFAFWAFHLASGRAPPRRAPAPGQQPRLSFEWSAPHDFPEDFGPLLALKQLVATNEGVTGALVDRLRVSAEVELRPGTHVLRVTPRTSLDITVAARATPVRKCRLELRAGRAAPDLEALASEALLELPSVRLGGVAGLLEGVWDLWSGEAPSPLASSARQGCVMALQLLEAMLSIHLSTVEGRAVGDQFLLFFSGSIGPLPFVRIHLPPFVLPRLHAPLSGLLSPQPLAGQRLRPGNPAPAAHPAALASWSATAEVACVPVAVDGVLHLRDGSRPTFEVTFQEPYPLLAKCSMVGMLSSDQAQVELKSFTFASDSPGARRDLRGSATCSLRLPGTGGTSPTGARAPPPPIGGLPELLFQAQCRGSLVSPLEARASLHLERGSELPVGMRVAVADEHPLMLGRANVVAVITRAALHGRCALHGELPINRKRDLLQLPEVDLHFDAAVALEEKTSYVDDGFSTAWFQDVSATASGRVWSESSSRLKGEASVEGAGSLTAEIRDSSIVQALLEAEAAAVRFGAAQRPLAAVRTPRASPSRKHSDMRLEPKDLDDNEMHASAGFCVRAGDAIQCGVGGKADGKLCLEVNSGPAELPELRAPRSSPMGRSPSGYLLFETTSDFLLVSLAGSVANFELGEARAEVGDLAVSLPPMAQLHIDTKEAQINAEGIGRTHLHLAWTGLGQPLVRHTAKKISALLPPLPSSGGVTMEIGDMGQVSLTYNGKFDAVALGNRVLDEEIMYGPFLELAAMLNLEEVLAKLLNFARVVRNILRTEGIEEPKDVIPAPRLARFLARVMLEIGTDGRHVASPAPSDLEKVLLQIVEKVVDAKGLDVTRITRLLWDHLPAEANAFVQHYTAEVDFAIKWFDTVLRPTEAAQGPDPTLAHEKPPSVKYRRELQEVAASASRLYEALATPGRLPRDLEDKLLKAAPYLTTQQVEHILRACQDLEPGLRRRLQFLFGLKRRVEKVAEGYGGPAFMPQGMAVGFFLATAIRGSFTLSALSAAAGASGAVAQEEQGGAGGEGVNHAATLASGRLAEVLREQMAVATELRALQEHQQRLVSEAAQLIGLEDAARKGWTTQSSDRKWGAKERRAIHHRLSGGGAARGVGGEPPAMSTMLDCLAVGETSCVAAKAALRSNAALAAQKAQVQRQQRRTEPSQLAAPPPAVDFDLGCSLLGPMEVAVLLMSGLAAVPQGRQVQQNQRMLLEILVSQPPLFQRGVLYELSNNGSSRVLSNHLLALLDLTQDAVKPECRLDVADLLTTALGIQMPRRADFMAGGTYASNSYILFVHRAAKQVLEESQPYVALKYWLQRAEVPVPLIRGEIVSTVVRVLSVAEQAVQDADLAGAAWLRERGPVWYEGVLSNQGRRGGLEDRGESTKKSAMALYEIAFTRCAAALKAHPELLQAPWFKEFWARNYDALTVVSVLRNAQQNVDRTRKWVDAQLRHAKKSESFQGVEEACDALWSTDPACEACLVDCVIEILFFYPEDRAKYRKDSLMQLVIDEPPGDYHFTVVSAMGVITEGAAGTEMSHTYARLKAQRGVCVVRADTATLQSVDWNATEIEKAVREQVRTPWGWVGYSQGCANAFRAEALMLQGTPQQRKLLETFRCRQLLFSAANGSAHATCGAWKLLRALVDGERFFKRFQANMSATTQQLALDLLRGVLSSRVAYAFLGSVQSLTHEGARRMWRDCQHCGNVPSTSMIGIVEDHTLPECLQMLSNVLVKQMDYSKHQDTQVAEGEAVAHPIGVCNANAELLAKLDMHSAAQRTHHWSPLKEEVAFLQTEKDITFATFDTPKDRHIFPWLEVNARFGIIDRLPTAPPRQAGI